MILGFGKTEVDAAHTILTECVEAMQNNLNNESWAVNKVAQCYMKAAEEYKTISRNCVPERYCYFFPFLWRLYEGKYFVEIAIHHINRNHPFSPDGWAMLKSSWILSYSSVDGSEFYQQIEAIGGNS